MANENLGTVPWHCHKDSYSAFIRQDKREKFYIYCNKCGIFGAKGRTFQELIDEEGVMYSDPKTDYSGGGEAVKANEHPEAPEKEAETIPERKAENFTPAPEVVPKKQPQKIGGLMSGLLSALGSEE